MDCARDGKAALSAKKKYAGLFKHAALAEARKVASVVKTKAHRCVSGLPAGDEREDAVGNAAADRAAKEAVKLHPQPTPAQVQDLDASCKRATMVIRTIAAVLSAFPPMPKERMVRRPADVEGANFRGVGGHEWHYIHGLWRCCKCLCCTIGQTLTAKVVHSQCKGIRPGMMLPAIADKGHDVVYTAGRFPIVFCGRCGAFSWRRSYGLAVRCPRRPTPAGKQALVRLRNGMVPWISARESHLPRRRIDAAGGGVWCPTTRRTRDFLSDRTAAADSMDDSPADQPHSVVPAAFDQPCQRDDDAAQLPGEAVRNMDALDGEEPEYDVFGHGFGLDDNGAEPIVSGTPPTKRRRMDGASSTGDAHELHDDGERVLDANVDARLRDGVEAAHPRENDAEADPVHPCHAVDVFLLGPVGTGGGAMAIDAVLHTEEKSSARTEAISTATCAVGARVGPGAPPTFHATVAVAGSPATPATAAVVEEGGRAAILQRRRTSRETPVNRGEAAHGPPSGRAEPLDSPRNMTKKRRKQYSPQVLPTSPEAGSGITGLAEIVEQGERPAIQENARRRDGTDSPARKAAAARHGDVAAVPRGQESPATGDNLDHVPYAHNSECQTLQEITGIERDGNGGKRTAALRAHGPNARHGAGGAAAATDAGAVTAAAADAAAPGLAEAPMATYEQRDRGASEEEIYLHGGGGLELHPQRERHRLHRERDWPDHGRGPRGSHRHGGPPASDEGRRARESHRHEDPGGDRRRRATERHGDRHGPTDCPRGDGAEIVPQSCTFVSVERNVDDSSNDHRAGIASVASGSEGGDGNPLPATASSPTPPVHRQRRGGRQSQTRDDGPGRGDRREPDGVDQLDGWVMPWMRTPAWMYLPHLADGAGGAGGGVAGPLDAHAAASGASHGPTRSSSPRDAGPTMPGDQLAERGEIQGREHAPGRALTVGSQTAAIRGPTDGLGPRCTDAQARAQERLDDRNWRLRRSLDDHGDRVRRKRELQQQAQCGPSPSERMAALRRRVASRSSRMRAEGVDETLPRGTTAEGSHHGRRDERGEDVDAGIVAPATGGETSVDPSSGSNEDRKIHQLQVHGGRDRIRDTACQDRGHLGACTGEDAAEVRMEAVAGHVEAQDAYERRGIVAPPSGDVTAAASTVAWHSCARMGRP